MKAFPNPHAFNAESAQLGMDLRDYFAAQAMQAILTSGKRGPKTADELHYDDTYDSVMNSAMCLAEGAYQMADAMLTARSL